MKITTKCLEAMLLNAYIPLITRNLIISMSLACLSSTCHNHIDPVSYDNFISA